ncbi:hypothetical protein QQF64_001328 [Cirrhinus molitorella]|uniref:Tc1-like transposase DDE domain-containing protein n=1 Tax=Cirrhinus molitorella TaxID=172907 RepID=A0ABR3NZR0_9TELE
MPKIHPETKVLIIKRLKTRSTADVADTFNVSQRQVQRIKKDLKRLETFLTSPAELHETWSPEVPVSTRTFCRIVSRNGLHGRISAQKPALNKRQLKNRVAFAKAHSLLKGWTLEKWQKVDFSDESSVELHYSRRKYCRRPTGARMDPRFTQKTVKFGGGKIMVWGYIQYGGVREICRVEGNINSLKYQEILATLAYTPNHKRGQILQQDGAPSHTSISTSKFLKAKKIKMLQDWPAQSPDMNITEHRGRMKEEAWKTKPKNIKEL